MHHNLTLAHEPFQKIAHGEKTIESRLFDEKRQDISIGDTIIFHEAGKSDQELTATVTNLLRYDSFAELFAHHHSSLFGGTSADSLLTEIRQFYSEEDEQKYEDVGIVFDLHGKQH